MTSEILKGWVGSKPRVRVLQEWVIQGGADGQAHQHESNSEPEPSGLYQHWSLCRMIRSRPDQITAPRGAASGLGSFMQ